jgi:Tfp pilus assembly protein PilF
MNTSRLDMLLQYYKEEPNDPFNIYALALEYLKSDLSKSQELFTILLSSHESYLPAYYHSAKLFHDLRKKEKAIEIYEKGMAIARKQQDQKTLRELQSAYQEMMFE